MHLLLDPDYWRPRLERLEARPRHLAIFPRPDLERPGIEVLELRLQAHDGERLSALLARSAFAQSGGTIRVRPAATGLGLRAEEPDWLAVEAGESDLVLQYPADRRLEDRVLDVLRVVEAACSIESVGGDRVAFTGEAPEPSLPDEFAIARRLHSSGLA